MMMLALNFALENLQVQLFRLRVAKLYRSTVLVPYCGRRAFAKF